MSSAGPATVRVAVTQHEPVWLDLQGTVAKTIAIIKQAAAEGAKLVAFPECWIPGKVLWKALRAKRWLTSCWQDTRHGSGQ